jgi:arylformamidase
VWHNATAWGGDRSRIVVIGHSAGGHLAALLAVCQWSKLGLGLPQRLLKAVLSVSGLHELESIRRCPYLQESVRLTAADARRASPAWMPAPSGEGACEVAAYCGGHESEEFIRHNQLLQDAWGPLVVPTCATVPEADHFTVLDALCDPAQPLHRTALRLLGLN